MALIEGKSRVHFEATLINVHLKKMQNGCYSFHTIMTLFQQLQNICPQIHDLLDQMFIILSVDL